MILIFILKLMLIALILVAGEAYAQINTVYGDLRWPVFVLTLVVFFFGRAIKSLFSAASRGAQ